MTNLDSITYLATRNLQPLSATFLTAKLKSALVEYNDYFCQLWADSATANRKAKEATHNRIHKLNLAGMMIQRGSLATAKRLIRASMD